MREDAAAGLSGDRTAEMIAAVVRALAGIDETHGAVARHVANRHAAWAVVGSMTAIASVIVVTGKPDSLACSCTIASFGER